MITHQNFDEKMSDMLSWHEQNGGVEVPATHHPMLSETAILKLTLEQRLTKMLTNDKWPDALDSVDVSVVDHPLDHLVGFLMLTITSTCDSDFPQLAVYDTRLDTLEALTPDILEGCEGERRSCEPVHENWCDGVPSLYNSNTQPWSL